MIAKPSNLAIAFPIVLVAALARAQPPGGPEFAFVRSPRTNLHVAVQPQPDYHRIHVMLRVRDGAGKQLFARVRSVPGSNADSTLELDRETSSVARFTGTTNDDLWSFYLRVPRYGAQTATYQAEVGTFDSGQIDQHQVHRSFSWEIYRDASLNGTMRVEGPDGTPLGLPIETRRAIIDGGSVRIVKATRLAGPGDLSFGVTTMDGGRQVDGAAIAEKVN